MIATAPVGEPYDLGDDCRKFAEQCPNLSAFWHNCQRSDWMIMLLDASGYWNGDKLWEFFRRVTELAKQDRPKDEIDRWREGFYKNLQDLERQRQEEVAKGWMSAEHARWSNWCGAYVWTEVVTKDHVSDSIQAAIFHSVIRSHFEGKTEDEKENILRADKERAFRQTLKVEADLLREVLQNPYYPRNYEDFRP